MGRKKKKKKVINNNDSDNIKQLQVTGSVTKDKDSTSKLQEALEKAKEARMKKLVIVKRKVKPLLLAVERREGAAPVLIQAKAKFSLGTEIESKDKVGDENNGNNKKSKRRQRQRELLLQQQQKQQAAVDNASTSTNTNI